MITRLKHTNALERGWKLSLVHNVSTYHGESPFLDDFLFVKRVD